MPQNQKTDNPKADREKTKWTDVAMVILTAFIAGAALWSAWIFQGQLNEAGKQTAAVERQMRQEQRAWVGIIDLTDIKVRVGEYPSFTVVVVNNGKTPALHVHAETTARSIPQWQKIAFEYPPRVGVQSDTAIQPNAQVFLKDVGAAAYGDQKITQLQFDAGRSGKMIAYIYGRMDYLDIFQTLHHTTFCAVLMPDLRSYAWCDQYNNAD